MHSEHKYNAYDQRELYTVYTKYIYTMDKELRFYLNSNVYLPRVIPATNKSIKCYNFKYELQNK